MYATTVVIQFSTAQLRDNAMRLAGRSPSAMAIKPGIRVQRNRRTESRLGHVKHKGRGWD